MIKKALFILLAPLALLGQEHPELPTLPSLLNLGIGCFGIIKGTKWPLFQLEYRSNYRIFQKEAFFIRPLLGAMANTAGSSYFYGGIAVDFFAGKYAVITPSFAPGLYAKGDGKNLHFPLEFRSSIEVAGRFKNESRMGVQFYHISNASLGKKNPGTECLLFFYSFPIPSSLKPRNAY